MSEIKVGIEGNILTIKRESVRKNIEESIDISKLIYEQVYHSNVRPTNATEKNKIFLMQEIGTSKKDIEEENEEQSISKDVIIVYSSDGEIKYSFCEITSAIKRVLKFKYKILRLSVTRRRIKLIILGYFVNKAKLKLEDKKLYIDQVIGKEYDVKDFKKELSKTKIIKNNLIKSFNFKMKDILQDDSEINGITRVSVNVNGVNVDYRIGIRNRFQKNPRYYYTPIKCKYIGKFAIHFRRTQNGNLVFVKRLKEPIENTLKFRFLESKFISWVMYKLGKKSKKKINIFYEKFAEKAEEGVFELCQMCDKSTNTKNYFVIDGNTKDYEKIKKYPNVVKKYSFKYYWLFYNAKNLIASEAPGHLNILRTNNKWFKRATYDKPFIFLQHGIIYMKNLGVNSSFNKGRESECKYMVVSSEKEKDVVAQMLGYNEEELLKTGLGMFSKIDYNHINKDSDDYVTIMLTWKPYEEHLYNFEESSYYQNVIKICNLLKKYIDKEKILIISHPKAHNLLENTDLKSSMWHKPISDALKKTKLLITDYSSVCYNTFYQGGAVIFYQEDINKYEEENGKLIPEDKEYIGKRAFDINELEEIIKDTIKDKKIDLSKVRTKEFEENYKTINEFSDGKNIERIYENLVKLNIV